MPTSLMLLMMFMGSGYHRAEVRPFLYQDEGNPKTHLKAIRELATNGTDLFILKRAEPGILQIKADGSFVRLIGGKGKGPGELGYQGSYAMAVRDSRVWIHGSNGLLNYYENGAFVTGFKTRRTQFRPVRASFQFVFDENVVISQAFPGTGKLVYLFDYGGETTGSMGAILPIEDQFLRVNPALNNTMWTEDEDYFYCLFFYRPILRIFSKKTYQLVNELIISGPEVEMFEDRYMKLERDTRFTYPLPHFTDFQIHKGDLFLLCDGFLYQIDIKTAELKSRTVFWADKLITNWDVPRVPFFFFAITASGELFLVDEALGLGHEGLWTTDLPFLK